MAERDLVSEIQRVDGKGYRSYKDLKGSYRLDDWTLFIDHVQGDPFAAPSRLRLRISQKEAQFPDWTYCNRIREVALRDLIARRFWESGRMRARGGMGSGGSGRISIPRPGQEILERSSVVINQKFIEVRFTAGLPAQGRRIDGENAIQLLTEHLPVIAQESMLFPFYKEKRIQQHIWCAEDSHALRSMLDQKGLVAFVADGSVLPRRSGVDQWPLSKAIPFRSPPRLKVTVDLPNIGKVTGMGIPKGLTLIVGGGYHGKSTLLEAVKHGVYDHMPGDGRELVVTVADAVKVGSEDGRRVEKVDISPFIADLPGGLSTKDFSTDNASGSTSQATNIMEALELGTSLLLIDEDSSASNFMTRDRRMQMLVSKDNEPIKPFVDRVRPMMESQGCSCILVVGGSGEFLDIADTVIMLSSYKASEATKAAKDVAESFPSDRESETDESFSYKYARVPLSKSLDPSRGGKDVKVSAREVDLLTFGKEDLDLSSLEQLVDISQTRTVADAMVLAWQMMDGETSMAQLSSNIMDRIEEKSLDCLGDVNGERAAFRRHELIGAINRLRTLTVYQKDRSR